MNKRELQEKLQYFIQDDSPVHVEMYLQYEEEDGSIKTYLPAVEENKLSSALSKMVSNQIKNKFFIENDVYDYEVVNASTAEASNNRQVFHVNHSEIPKASIIFNEVVKDEAEEFQRNLVLDDVWAYIFKVSTIKETIYIFKKNYPINLLKKENTYGIIFTNNKLSLFDKDLLRLSKNFDVILIESELIILNRSEFERAFDYVGAMQTKATANVDVIKRTKLIEVEGLNKIAELSRNKRTLRKLLNINPKSKFLNKTPKEIARIAKKYKVKFNISEDETKLSITTKKSALEFVELLNDDYLKSEFSGSLYKIKGKAQI
jgi:hypothetical protein